MKFGSVCSGIEAASVAWEPLGWSASWFAEIDPFPSAVLAHHYPEVPNVGDMTLLSYLVGSGILEAPDVLVGGTPCQAFSVAGARKSLDDDRGQLSLEFIKLANAIDERRNDKPSIIVWENVPGVLSTKDNAFGCFLGALAGEDVPLDPTGARWANAGCVYGPQRAIAWRVLDAQYFGVAQRRRRVFVVASAREDFDPAQVLFEFDGVRRDIAPSRSSGQETTGSIGESPNGTIENIVGTLCASDRKGVGNQMVGDGKLIVHGEQAGFTYWNGGQLAGTLTRNGVNQFMPDKNNAQLVYAVHGTQDPITSEDTALPLGRNSGQENAVYSVPILGGLHPNAATDNNLCPTLTQAMGVGGGHVPVCAAYSVIGDVTPKFGEDICMTLRSQGGGGIVPPSVKPPVGLVRRLTPIECERLQGFPDNWTRVPYRKKPAEECPDGPRYAACGNSMAVPVMEWIGRRIDAHVITA